MSTNKNVYSLIAQCKFASVAYVHDVEACHNCNIIVMHMQLYAGLGSILT